MLQGECVARLGPRIVQFEQVYIASSGSTFGAGLSAIVECTAAANTVPVPQRTVRARLQALGLPSLFITRTGC